MRKSRGALMGAGLLLLAAVAAAETFPLREFRVRNGQPETHAVAEVEGKIALRDDTPGSDAVITLLPDGSMNYYGPQNRLLEKLIVTVNLLNANCQFVCSRK